MSKIKQNVYSKSEIVSCDKYSGVRDIVSAVLSDGVSYSCSEVDKLVDDFLKGSVK